MDVFEPNPDSDVISTPLWQQRRDELSLREPNASLIRSTGNLRTRFRKASRSRSCGAASRQLNFTSSSNRTAIIPFRRGFPPELIYHIASGFNDSPLNAAGHKSHPNWTDPEEMATHRRTIYACCLVCNRWHVIFRPYLYKYIAFFADTTVSLFLRSIWHTNTDLRKLVRGVAIYMVSWSGPFYGWAPLPLSLPNLQYFYVLGVNIPMCPSTALSRIIRRLPVTCHTKITLGPAEHLPTPSIHRFVRHLGFKQSHFVWMPADGVDEGGEHTSMAFPKARIVRATLKVGNQVSTNPIRTASINTSLYDMGVNLKELVLDLHNNFRHPLNLQNNPSLRVLVLRERPGPDAYDKMAFGKILPPPSSIATRKLHIIFQLLDIIFLNPEPWEYLRGLRDSGQIPELRVSFEPSSGYMQNAYSHLTKAGIEVPCPPFVKELQEWCR